MSLKEKQINLLDYITGKSLVIPPGFKYPHRLFIYREGHFARIREVIQDAFSKTVSFIPADRFDALIQEYGLSQSFSGFDISSVVRYFPAFLATRWDKNEYFFSDLALLEEYSSQAFNALQKEPLTWDELNRSIERNAEKVILKIQPGVRILVSKWALLDICDESTKLKNDTRQNNWFCPVLNHYLIYRHQWQVKVLPLSEEQCYFFQLLKDGFNLFDSCNYLEKFLEKTGASNEPVVHEWLFEWLNLEIFSNTN